MKTFNKIIFTFFLTIGSLAIYAQQDPMFTHYMNNTLSVNPGYAGSRDALTVTALHRSQWVDFTGAPITQTLTMHTPLRSEHIGIGLTVLNDKIGPTNNTALYADFAYIMKVTSKSKLALGLSGGVNIFRANLNTLDIDQQNDPAFINNINNKITPNFGFGAYYYREKFYVGISVPKLLENDYAANIPNGENTLVGKEQRHYFFIAGALINLTDNLAFKPTTLVKVTMAAPIQADFTASFVIMKRLLIGAMVRTGDAFGGLVGLDITDQLHIGYSYDWSYGLKTSKYNKGSHELMLRYDFDFLSKKQIHSPRNF
jgi:type IX secretion system PorP/SprF family membrane protein